MAHVTSATRIENDDLTCPITLELFRDPVIAKDGRTYEREAITKWILEHGTSPFTREPLQISDLQSDNHLRRIAAQRRNSTVSYNVQNESITLPPLRRQPIINTRVAPEVRRDIIRTNYLRPKCSPLIICMVIVGLFIGVAIALGIVLASQYSNSTDFNTTSNYSSLPIFNCLSSFTSNYSNLSISTYSGSLTKNSSIYMRPGTIYNQYYYQAIQVLISTSGIYNFKSISSMDTYGYLYNSFFNYLSPYVNLLISNDDSGGGAQFCFRISLPSGNYTLVTTTYSRNVTGNFSIVVTGPVYVTFQ